MNKALFVAVVVFIATGPSVYAKGPPQEKPDAPKTSPIPGPQPDVTGTYVLESIKTPRGSLPGDQAQAPRAGKKDSKFSLKWSRVIYAFKRPVVATAVQMLLLDSQKRPIACEVEMQIEAQWDSALVFHMPAKMRVRGTMTPLDPKATVDEVECQATVEKGTWTLTRSKDGKGLVVKRDDSPDVEFILSPTDGNPRWPSHL